MDIEWFYPHPDYKFPIDIYSDNHLPTVSQLKEVANWPYDHNRVEIFSENKAFFNILNAGLYPEFSNSFLVPYKQSAGLSVILLLLSYLYNIVCDISFLL